MTSNTKARSEATISMDSSTKKSQRLYYLDWLRVLLIFGVFLFHVLSPFATMQPWHIKNGEQSIAVMAILRLFDPWGIPLFFLVAGAASMFALLRRSNGQYIVERVNRLLIPFIVGSLLLMPFQKYLESLHFGRFEGSFLSYIPGLLEQSFSGNLFSPLLFSRWGLHLWFLGFLFAYSMLGLPIFRWFARDAGRSLIAWLGRLAQVRGGILTLILPLALARVLLQPFFPPFQRGWLDFIYTFLFFIMGYILYADDRFALALRRDRWIIFGGGLVGLFLFFGLFGVYGDAALEWSQAFVLPWSVILIFAFTAMSWGWALFVLSLSMKHLNFSNKLLAYGNDTIMPFYLLHQPVIIVIAYFVVQWDAGILLKLLLLGISSFLITLGLVELLIRPFKPMRRLFGMKPRRKMEEKTKTAA